MPFWSCEKCNGSGTKHGFWKNLKSLLLGQSVEKCDVCFGDGIRRPSEKNKPPPPPRPPLPPPTEIVIKILEKKH